MVSKYINCTSFLVYLQDSDTAERQPSLFHIAEDSEDASPADSSDSSSPGATIHVPLGHLKYSEEEVLACQVSIKMSSNLTDAAFLRQINFISRGLLLKRHKLPQSRYKVTKQLKKLSRITPTWVAYCPICLGIVSETPEKPQTGTCDKGPDCNKYDLKEDLAAGNCLFMSLSIKEQIKSYLKNKNFRHVIRKFSKMKGSHLGGKLHKGLIEAGHFDLSLGIDAGQMHNFSGKQILPAVLFFNNLPVSWQLRFPILAALWTGQSGKKYQPPRNLFLQKMQEELRRLGTVEEVEWRDDLGKTWRSKTFLTTVLSDGPEKADLLNQVGTAAAYACPFCFVKGKILRREKYPHIFLITNKMRKTTGKKYIHGIRFPKLIHVKKCRWRESQERLAMGLAAARKRLALKDTNYHNKGIKGLPALRTLPGFKETDSHVSDTLHLIAHGVLKDMLKVMVKGKPGEEHTFLTSADNGDFKKFDDMMDSMTRVSESDRNCRHLETFTDWKAYDALQFLLHDVALLCSNETIIKSKEVYKSLVHLSNMVYLSHYGRQSENIRRKHRRESKRFCKVFVEKFTEEYNTYKVHVVTAHGSEFLDIHGSASYTDGFNLERFISCLKKLCTTNKLHMGQIFRNFLIKHHSKSLQNMDGFSDAARETLNENGFFSDEFYCKFEDVVKSKHETQVFPRDVRAALNSFITNDLKTDPRTLKLTRVTRMIRKSIILESSEAKHKANTKINDSYIHLEGGEFGQISDIAYEENSGQFLFVMKKFVRVTPTYSNNETIPYPINQIPYDEAQFPDLHVFLLTQEMLIQKAQVSISNYYHNGNRVRFFSIQPNEWFRY